MENFPSVYYYPCMYICMWMVCVSLGALQVSAWISEKMQVATDESYRDPTNLSGKLKKHQAFEAELSANRNTLDAVCGVSHLVMGGGGRGWGPKVVFILEL